MLRAEAQSAECLPLIGRKKNPLKLEVGEVVEEHELQEVVKELKLRAEGMEQLVGLELVVVRGLGLGLEWVWGFW